MRVEVKGKTIDIEPNSKPYLIKRIIADGFDTALIFGLFILFTALLMRSSFAANYNAHYARFTAIEEETKAAFGNDEAAAAEALNSNREYLDERFAASLHGYLLKAAAGFLAGFPVLLAVPLLNRDRATPGKLMTGAMPFNERKQNRAEWYQILSRFMFVFLIDCIWIYIWIGMGLWTFILVPVLRLISILISKKDKTVCDMVTGIMIIDKLSYNGIK